MRSFNNQTHCARCKEPWPEDHRFSPIASQKDGKSLVCILCMDKEVGERIGIDPPYEGKIYWQT